MRIGDLHEIVRRTPALSPDDSLAKAIRWLRARDLPMLPVAEGARLVGVVREGDIARAIAVLPSGAAAEVPVAEVVTPPPVIAFSHQTMDELRLLLQEAGGEPLPVLTAEGRYLGMILARDALAALAGEPLVPPVAGLATPLGVYLTTGAVRAGAGNLGLAATGAALMVINLLAGGALNGIGWLLDRLAGSQGPPPSDEVRMVAAAVVSAVHMLLFLLLLRLSPLAAIHAAEHMVVHAIEEGEDLSLEKVRAMPRVHPRCGTNLMALMILLVIAGQFLNTLNQANQDVQIMVLFALVLIVLLTWRRLGAGLQRWVTTRPPSDRQLARGVEVGRRLLEEIRRHPGARANFWQRVWNAGFVQVISGFFLTTLIVDYAPVVFGFVSQHLTK